jgi:hypothetical protein
MESMFKHRKLLIFFGIFLLITFSISSILVKVVLLSPNEIAIHIVIDNRTNRQIGPFVLIEHQDSKPLQINAIEPFSVVYAYYKKSESWGENEIMMSDINGTKYNIIPYFENGEKGLVDIRVECATPNALSGKIRFITTSYSSFEWRSWGTSNCP